MKPSSHRSVLMLALTTLTALWAGCHPPDSGDDASSTPHSERGGIGMQTRTQEIVSPSQVVDARKSLAVTETAILANFTLPAVLNQLATQNGNPNFTGQQLFRQLWDTQNAGPGQPDLQPSAHCTDNNSTLNGFPMGCRPSEGVQASPTSTTNINSYSAIGLFNRFDLAASDGADCGEYRVVFGKTGGGTGRNFIIFEATLPNPRQDLGLEGCRQVQAFWRDLSRNTSVSSRATALRDFYFTGLPGFSPVIHMGNFGFNSAGAGQIRVNMFIQPLWMLKEFKLQRQCPGGVCSLKAVPTTVKTNPFGGLFNPNSTHPQASQFKSFFISQVQSLAVNDVNTFNYSVPDQFNAGQSDAQSSGGVDDYVAQFAGPSAFRTSIQNELNRIGSTLTPDNIVARAQALSCGGCHQSSSGAGLGNGMVFPQSALFVHNSESTETGPDGTRFRLSQGLTGTFLPFRKSLVEEFLSAAHPITGSTRFDMAGSAADGQFAYWVENRASGSVVKASLNSGSEKVLAFNRPNPTAVATDGVNVYWTEAAGTILKVPANGGTITTLATGLAGLGGIATDGTNLFFTQGSSIVRMSINGGTPTTLFANRVGLTGRIAVDGANLYWQEGNNIQKAPKAGGTVSLLISRASISGLATDGTHVYLAENLNPGNLLRLPVAGGTPTVFLSGPRSLTSVAVGANHLVWTENTAPGAVMAKVKN